MDENIYVGKAILCNNMNQTKLAQQHFNLSEEISLLLYHVILLDVCSTYNIILEGFIVNKNPYNGKPSENIMANWKD